ncbi:MAG: alcohol dehydrogenase catalytic domain-containing protein [Clostridiales Family XIII bacterium]|jgi:L-iditol 2-dehydrogenase|nr:alcohol dehydrogenase catalytic domain-containing protein [Clostridiales Family XIII bacterium]
MKALVKFANGSEGAEIRDLDRPEPKDDELLIRVLAAGICGTDIHILNDEYECRPPVVMGHEYTGVVEVAGRGATGFAPGDQVISMTAVSCEHCQYCRRGLLMLCEERRSIGSVNMSVPFYTGGRSRFTLASLKFDTCVARI